MMGATCFAADTSSNINNTGIIDPAIITISPWQVYVGDGDPPPVLTQDDLSWHAPHDSQWPAKQKIQEHWQALAEFSIPHAHFSIQKKRWFHSSFIVGWHHKNAQLALSLGPLYSEAEVYVNGVKLLALKTNEPASYFRRAQTRIYRLPRQKLLYSFLDFQVENQIRVQLTSNKEPLVLIAEQIDIDNYGSLVLKAKDSDTLIKIAQGSMVALLLSFCLFSIFMRAVGFKERNNTLFGSYVICVACGMLSDSLLLPAELGYWSGLSPLPLIFTTLSILILVVLLSPRQRVSRTVKYLLLLNFFVLMCLVFERHGTMFYEWLVLANHTINAVVVVHALCVSMLHVNKMRFISNDALLILVFVGWCVQSLWAFNYSPAKPLEITLFITAIALLLNVVQRFKAMASSLLTLSNRLVSIREKERERLTRDIHDGVGQGLSALKLLINLNASKLESNLGEILQTEVSNTSNTLKSVIRNLKPIEVVSGSPTQAIINLAQHNGHLSNIEINLLASDDVTLTQERAYQVYRIGQEALNNALKHSQAKQITLSFIVLGQLYNMQIEDDGKRLQDGASDGGYGMSSMHERSMILGATLHIKNNDLGGTAVLLEVPIDD